MWQLIKEADTIEAHNAEFETAVWHHVCHKRMGWPDLPREKLRCSAARAAMCALPRSLGAACAVLGLPIQKDGEGHKLMMKFCKPHKARKIDCPECIGTGRDFIDASCVECQGTGKLPGGDIWHEDLDDYVKLCRYCMTDTDSERGLSKALPPLPEEELKLWQLDQRMNARGVRLDRESTIAWIAEIEKAEISLRKEWKELTGGKVDSPTQRNKVLDYFKTEFNLTLDDLAKDTVADAIESLAEPETP